MLVYTEHHSLPDHQDGKDCHRCVFAHLICAVLTVVCKETKTKAATKDANTRTARRPKKGAPNAVGVLQDINIIDVDAANKPKREPTAYEIFRKEQMKKWNEENPGRAKEAMGHVG